MYSFLNNKLSIEEINDFLSRACVQLEPELTQQLISICKELIEFKVNGGNIQ